MMKRRAFISFIMASMLLVSFVMSAGEVFSASIDDIQNQISSADGKRDDLAGQLDEVNDALAKRKEELEANSKKYAELAREQEAQSSEIEKQMAELEELFDEIEALQQTIAEAEENYQEALDMFFRRAAILYRYSDYNPLQLFIESKNVFIYSDRARLLQSILQSDRQAMEELDIMKRDLDAKKAQVEITSVDLEAVIAEKETVLEKLRNSQAIVEEDLQASRSAIEKLEAQEAKLLEETERISNNIRNLQDEYDRLLKEKAEKEAAERAKQEAQQQQGTTTPTPSVTPEPVDTSKMLWPAQSGTYISSPYGNRLHPVYGVWKFHSGVDIPAPGGSNILAAADGTVMTAVWSDSYGYYVVIYHGDGLSTLYAHSSKLLVKEGDTVSRGQVIALVGTTGISTGNHLHFEVRVNGNTQDPLDYLP